jgi:hypothetical protein
MSQETRETHYVTENRALRSELKRYERDNAFLWLLLMWIAPLRMGEALEGLTGDALTSEARKHGFTQEVQTRLQIVGGGING